MATPIAASHQSCLPHEPPSTGSSAPIAGDDGDDIRAFSASLASMLDTTLNLTNGGANSNEAHPGTPAPPTNGHIVLPLPASSLRTHSPYVLPGPRLEEAVIDLPPDIASADISISPDYTFVETSSGAAAREIKRRFDQYIGVGKDVRSPYAITAFVNMFGKQMYRVGDRELSAPGASIVDDVDVRSTRAKSTSVESTTSHTSMHPPRERRSRLSMHSFLPPVMFPKNGTTTPHAPPKSPTAQEGSRSPPVRKLRKTRSIPNLISAAPEIPTSSPAPPVTSATGRPHAHSVSSVDAFRPPMTSISTSVPPPPHDIFSDVMSWNNVPPSPLSSGSQLRSARSFYSPSDRQSDHQKGEHTLDIVRHPFGKGVLFDTPTWHSPSHLSSPPVLREMQSFESGLTARADPSPRGIRTGKLRATRHSDDSMQIPEEEPLPQADTPVVEQPTFEPLAEPSMLSRYPTDLFDVLQNYKGIPVIDSIAADPHQTTIRLSLKAEESTAPKDDPRFVIWGEVEAGNASPSRSTTDISSGHSIASRRKSTRERSDSAMPSVQVLSGDASKRVLVAATIERWIAQLTSELNYDELLIFFLTYRTYVSALDLGHLLICRFHWALAQPSSTHDETVRRIVRVRTFIAIRYWLLTFFNIDFVPNLELRVLFADWLNTLRKDTILARHKDAMSIVLKLRKVVRDCKEAYTQSAKGGAQPQSKAKPKPVISQPSALGDLSNGNFAEALRKAVAEEDPDVDLNLDGVDGADASGVEFRINTPSQASNPSTSVDLHLLRQPLHLAFLQYGKQAAPAIPPPQAVNNQVQLPVPHSAISRVVVNAIGRLGRWKRVLNYRTSGTRAPMRPPLGLGATCIDATTFDVEASETGDLLMVRGGVEQYLKTVETQILARKAAGMYRPQKALDSPPPYEVAISHPSFASSAATVVDPEALESVREGSDEADPQVDEELVEATPVPPAAVPSAVISPEPPSASSSRPSSSFVTPSTLSFARPDLRSSGTHSGGSRFQMDVVSIDDLDLSDLSSTEELSAPPAAGLRRGPRRLPNRRDFEFVRHSTDSVSSMGIRTHDSVLSAGSSVISSAHASGNGDVVAGPIHQWQMNALVDSLSDDGESGDVEAALRRLEGQINEDKQRAKQSKVDGWVQSIRERLANGQFGFDRRRYSSDEEDYGEVQSNLREDASEAAPSRRSLGSRSRTSVSQMSSRNSVSSAQSPFSVAHPTPDDARAPAVPPGLGHSISHGDGKPAPEDVVPFEILQSRVPSRPTTSAGSPPAEVSPPPLPTNRLSFSTGPTSAFAKPEKSLRRHRSFVLSYKSDTLIQHFAMIDRELFLNLKFDELVSQDSWMMPSEEYNILDWTQFMRDRKNRAEGSGVVKTSALTAIRCRFNLMANFVIAEIVLTHPSERLMVLSKFIRIAWKAYIYKNFNTLVAILAAVDSQWIQKAIRQSGTKLGIWENRMLRDLQHWSTSDGDFKYIRQAIAAAAEAKANNAASPDGSTLGVEGQGPTSRSRATSEGKPPPPVGCVPFFGVYLSELYRYSSLPDLVDPTAPHEPVDIDPETNTFEAPAHPEVFSNLVALPPSVQLEALINVHKQRLVAGVVKSLVSGQHIAAKVQYPIEKKLFQKCLRLRGLNAETLQRAMDLYAGRDA